jgi:hypothetical protein
MKFVTIQGIMTFADEGQVTPPIYYPPPVASHPIAPGGQPGVPTHPIYNPPFPSQGPGFPTNPIAPGGPPLGTWGGAGQPFPSNPIAPGGPPPSPGGGWQVAWSPLYGWVLIPPIAGTPLPPEGTEEQPEPKY